VITYYFENSILSIYQSIAGLSRTSKTQIPP